MTPADKRIAELIDRWLVSVDLHLKYVDLDQAAYDRVQAWPKHDRPTRWVLELARQKVLELKTQCESRVSMGDGKFAESLELMAFLANLVGAQHIQRFVPLANPKAETADPAAKSPASRAAQPVPTARKSDPDATREMPRLKPAAHPDATREMPQLRATAAPARTQAPIAKTERTVAKAEPKKPRSPPAPTAPPASSKELEEKIVADAIRLMRWGRQWHELAELVARIADRPAIGEVRRILRAHKAAIETQAGTEA